MQRLGMCGIYQGFVRLTHYRDLRSLRRYIDHNVALLRRVTLKTGFRGWRVNPGSVQLSVGRDKTTATPEGLPMLLARALPPWNSQISRTR